MPRAPHDPPVAQPADGAAQTAGSPRTDEARPAEAASEQASAVRRLARSQLARLLVAGTGGSSLVLLGASEAASPFAEHSPGAWFFQIGEAGHGFGQLAGVLAVYAGIVLLLGAWYRAIRLAGLRRLRLLLASWGAPLLAAPPLFSNDAYAYAASGELASRGGDPYLTGVAALHGGPFLAHVDRIWWHTVPPYGPLWERLVEAVVVATGHRLIATLAVLRLAAACSIAVLAWTVPEIAGLTGHDPARALAWAVLNPLVLLTLLGGMHNDAEMLALVATGLVVALRYHAVLGTLACACGAEVKVPALLAVAFVAWWAPPGGIGRARRAQRARAEAGPGLPARALRLGAQLALAAGFLACCSVAARLGWGWVTASLTPGKVVSLLDPATAVGIGLAHLAGAGSVTARVSWVAAARSGGVALAAAVAVVMLWRGGGGRAGWPAALGAALLALALLGPVVWPWYETWGIVLLAVAAATLLPWQRVLLGALISLGCFADLPSAGVLWSRPAALAAGGWAVLGIGAAGYLLACTTGPAPHVPQRRAGHSTTRRNR
ncbi:MAG TPA: polyprenol phosphomannose-dependent alpha 1,6 mannosyltransferase MptB [Acidimicrobiales bacterium]|nr:polyprenol phosphomannose-dependent alpha 1,6 mannosyltransferase MptB [Acidimicrobiales bacterium]